MNLFSDMQGAKNPRDHRVATTGRRAVLLSVAVLSGLLVAGMATGQVPLANWAASGQTDVNKLATDYEKDCVAGLDHGNDGDMWLDALEACERAANQIRRNGGAGQPLSAAE